MNIDLNPFFKRYENLSAKAEKAFERVGQEYSDCIKCKIGCADCCYDLSELTLIEALYINDKFNEHIQGDKKEKLLENANRTDRLLFKIRRQISKALKSGMDKDEILKNINYEPIPCPFLNDENKCDLYEYRPVICRLHGIPAAFQGETHTCEKSEFLEGKQYPTVNADIIYRELYAISRDFIQTINSKHTELPDMLFPLSTAVLTVYDDEYFGIKEKEQGEKNE